MEKPFDGWQSTYGDNQHRILADKLWYIEERNSSTPDVVTLAPITLFFLYLGCHCKMYDIPYSICTLETELAVFPKGMEIPSENGWVSSTREVQKELIRSSSEFIIKYKNITIANEVGEKDFLKDFFIRFQTTTAGYITLSGWRQEIQYSHVLGDYLHSHLNSFEYTNPFNVEEFCTGSEENATNVGLEAAKQAIQYSSYFPHIVGNVEYDKLETHASLQIDNFEYHISMLLGAINPLIKYESMEGVPHIYMRSVHLLCADGNNPLSSDEMRKTMIAFAEYCCNNISDTRIKYQIYSQDIVRILDSKSLVAVAKESGYFDKIFAFCKNRSRDYVIPAIINTVISPDDKTLVDSKMALLFSPFRWNGERIQCKAIDIPNTFIIDDEYAKLNEDYRHYFSERVEGYFKQRLRTYYAQA